eukprot:jgi/Psemu1/12769/gm1.12769_g
MASGDNDSRTADLDESFGIYRFGVTLKDLLSETTDKIPDDKDNEDTSYEVQGLTLKANPSKPKMNKPTQIGILYKKEHHPATGSKEETGLIKLITSKQGKPFKEWLNTSLKDPESLKNNLWLRQQLNLTEALLWKSTDLLNPCYIIFPISNSAELQTNADNTIKQCYLFTHYHHYYAQSVHFRVPNQDEDGTFNREFEWSYSYFRKKTDLTRLYETVQKEFQTYDPLEQGGPLFLKLLLVDHLVISNNDANKTALLVDTVKNYNIQQESDEDIQEVTKLLSTITNTILAIHDHNEHQLPDDYLQYLTKIYQTTTSSVNDFKQTFAKLEDGITHSQCLCTVTKLVALWKSSMASSANTNQTAISSGCALQNSPA